MLLNKDIYKALELLDQIEEKSEKKEPFNRLIEQLVAALGGSKFEFANLIGVTYQSLHRWTKGQTISKKNLNNIRWILKRKINDMPDAAGDLQLFHYLLEYAKRNGKTIKIDIHLSIV